MPRHLRWCIRCTSNHELIEKHQRRSLVLFRLFPCGDASLAGASLTKCTVPTSWPTNRFRDIRKSPRSFSFRLFVAFPFSLHSRHDVLSSLSRENAPWLSPVSPRDENWPVFPLGKSLRTIQNNLEYDLLLELFANIYRFEMKQQRASMQETFLQERCARDLSRTYSWIWLRDNKLYLPNTENCLRDIIFV